MSPRPSNLFQSFDAMHVDLLTSIHDNKIYIYNRFELIPNDFSLPWPQGHAKRSKIFVKNFNTT